MTKDEALKLSMEAMEITGGFDVEILAIKEALAQPEPWEKFCDSNCVWTDHHPDCKLAQPEQEPVALEAVYETIIQWDEGGGKRSRRELARRIVSLYTTPPQRKWVSLTENEIKECFQITPDQYLPAQIYKRIEAKLKEKNAEKN